MEPIDDLSLGIPLSEISEWTEFDDILDLGSAGTSPLSSPSHYSSGSHCSSPFSTGSSGCSLDSPDPLVIDQQLFGTLKTESVQKAGSDSKKKTGKLRRSRKSTQRSGETKHKRNERERRRVKKLSDAFVSLRDSVPSCIGDKKLSKLETLNYALYYMHNLSAMLYEDDYRKRSVQTNQWLSAMNQTQDKPSPTTTQVRFLSIYISDHFISSCSFQSC